MKGDKGEAQEARHNAHPKLINVVVEFAGILLGFDDYVSMLRHRRRPY